MQRKVIKEFINLYRDRPCLWNNKLMQYGNKSIRYRALQELLPILQKTEPYANLASVRKKIDNLRTNYNRERRKVMISESSGCPPGEVYRPTLWYFDQMKFLNVLDVPVGPTATEVLQEASNPVDVVFESKLEIEEHSLEEFGNSDHGAEFLEENSGKVQEAQEESEADPPPPKRIRLPIIKVRPQKFLKKSTTEQESSSEDELDCFSKMAAKTLRKLQEPTQSIALKLMSDVLYHAKMGNLSEASGITTGVTVYEKEALYLTDRLSYGTQRKEEN